MAKHGLLFFHLSSILAASSHPSSCLLIVIFKVYVDQMSYDIVAVTRHCPENHATVVLVAHTAFSTPSGDKVPSTENKHIQTFGIKPLHVEGVCLCFGWNARH